jgi:D-glycero-alpha-D-manno-heptose-7-phosphate kinase
VIITQTPLRISLGGGGTDLPSYYSQREGFLVAGAINKYIFVGVNKTFSQTYAIKYSAMEHVETVADIKHPIVREALAMHDVPPAVEIVSLADIPAGTGLGSSGTFTVGLLRAIHAFKREHISPADVAEEACRIEIDVLKEPVGKQDQYIASYGGLTCFTFHRDGTVEASALAVSDDTLYDLEDNLLMFFTGYSREAGSVLADQKQRSEQQDDEMLHNLDTVKAVGLSVKKALEGGDTRKFGELMHEHWLTKRVRSKNMSNDRIDHWYDVGIRNGAVGGKLVGAGAGGFLLFYAEDRLALRRAMAKEGLQELRFAFDHEGSKLTFQA